MTRTPEDVLREAQTHFALMVQHAQGNLDDQLVIDAMSADRWSPSVIV